MKKTVLVFGIAVITALCFSCKKDNSTSPTTDSDYYIQYTDNGSVIKLTNEKNSFYVNYNINEYKPIPLDDKSYKNDIWFNIMLPTDSSDISKVSVNKLYKTVKYKTQYDNNSHLGYFNPDSTIGAIYFYYTKSSGTDNSVDIYSTAKYYNKITSIKYLKSEYDKTAQTMKSYYVVTGEFVMQVKNDVTNTSRDLTNGSYKIVVPFLPK